MISWAKTLVEFGATITVTLNMAMKRETNLTVHFYIRRISLL